MKTVYLLRHGKSSWDDPDLPDHERPLAPRGENAAPRMGAYMREHGLVPDRVLCSSATRTRQTWDRAGESLNADVPVQVRDDLYAADPDRLLAALRQVDDGDTSVLIVGHNPALEQLAARLAGDGDPDALSRMNAKYPTGALAELRLDIENWAAVQPGCGRLVRFIRPKDQE